MLEEGYACALCLICAVRHKQLNCRLTQATQQMLSSPDIVEQVKELGDFGEKHKIMALLPFSHFQLL